jgi:alkylation response protein AidB-like acyl-CoA dehydrogenase
MYSLHLTAEQLEIRDTVRDFVTREIKPIALKSERLEACERHFPVEILDQASQMGLRTLALSEEAGGAGIDNLTSCIVTEELAVGDVGVAATLAQTSALGHLLFDQAMTPGQRARFLPQFLADDRYHLAFADHEPNTDAGWNYYRPAVTQTGVKTTAVRDSNGGWVINGVKDFITNAPIAKLIAVQVRTDPKSSGMNGVSTLLVSRDAPGLTVREPEQVPVWYHGTRGELVFRDCRVPAENLLGKEGKSPLSGGAATMGRGNPLIQAMNLGLGRAAYEAAVEYAKLRVQGGRPIIGHEAIGTILAEIAIKLEVARNMIWQAAWASDHPGAYADRSLADLPLETIARVFTSEVVHQVTLTAAEVFGAMGVMRDMPMQRYVGDALIFLHSGNSNSAAKLQIAEALAGYQRPVAA